MYPTPKYVIVVERAVLYTKIPLCVDFEEGPNHKSLLYAVLSCIFVRLLPQLELVTESHITKTLFVTSKLPLIVVVECFKIFHILVCWKVICQT